MSILINLSHGFDTPEGEAELEKLLAEHAENRRSREQEAILDPMKEHTGLFDMFCQPIYNGSILAWYSGYEGYWKVFKDAASGEWMKEATDGDPDLPREIVPLAVGLGESEIVESEESHLAESLKRERAE